MIDFDTSSLSPENVLPARILKLRARIQLGEAAAVISELEPKEALSNPDLGAVLLVARYVASPEDEDVKEQALDLARSEGDNLSVQLCVGTVLAELGLREEALALLARHQGSLDAYVSPTVYRTEGVYIKTLGRQGLRPQLYADEGIGTALP